MAGALPDDRSFLGTGWAFPVALDGRGDVAMVAGGEEVHQAVRIILATALGERAMRPDYGAGLENLAFEPLSTSTLALARHRVEQALVRFEPRIDVMRVSAEPAPGQPGRLDIGIEYRIRATNVFYNLVYPFYLVEGGEPR
jgi:phage baseplate assembly protein W